MSDGKLSEKQAYEQLKKETEIVGQAHDFLYTGRFPGGAAQQLAMCQMYLKGLYNHLKAECEKKAPLELPASNPVEQPKTQGLTNIPVVTPAEPLPELPTGVSVEKDS